MRWSSGLTAKKLTVLGPPGTVVASPVWPLGVRYRILVSPSRKNTWSDVALTGGWRIAPSCADEQYCTDGAATEALAAMPPAVLMISRFPAERSRP